MGRNYVRKTTRPFVKKHPKWAPKVIETICSWCEKPARLQGAQQLRWALRGRPYCSIKCRDEFTTWKRTQRTASPTERKNSATRMTDHNPMADPVARARQSTTLRAMGWKPPIQGGNGKLIPVAQQLLACALGWRTEVVYPTKMRRSSGYPAHYKLDIANEALQIGIEVDGPSHGALKVREADQRKQELLESRGWIVLRFSNRQVTEHLAGCVQTVLSTISKSRAPTPTSPKV